MHMFLMRIRQISLRFFRSEKTPSDITIRFTDIHAPHRAFRFCDRMVPSDQWQRVWAGLLAQNVAITDNTVPSRSLFIPDKQKNAVSQNELTWFAAAFTFSAKYANGVK